MNTRLIVGTFPWSELFSYAAPSVWNSVPYITKSGLPASHYFISSLKAVQSSGCPAACVCACMHNCWPFSSLFVDTFNLNQVICSVPKRIDRFLVFCFHVMDNMLRWTNGACDKAIVFLFSFLFQSLIEDLHTLHEEWLIEQKHVKPPAPVIVCIHCQQAGT